MAKFDKIEAGSVLYSVGRQGGRAACWTVRVVSVDREARTAECSWNGNKPTTYTEADVARLRWSPPRSRS